MCGIIAVVGDNATNILGDVILGLERLEYRGYDSSGIAFLNQSNIIECFKYQGRVKILKDNIKDFSSHIAIGHTRWATHGVPSDINAHPHSNGKLAIVHNGIIENYIALKQELQKKGYEFKSQTDTEIALILLYDLLKSGCSKIEALKSLFKICTGSFAIVVMFEEDNKIYGVKRGCPMVVGVGKNKNIIASDVYAIAGISSKVVFLEDEEIVIADKSCVQFFDNKGKEISKKPTEIKVKANDMEKGTYEHFMLKEIYEQSGALRNNFIHHYDVNSGEIFFPNFTEDFSRFKFIKIIACGTSYNAGFISKYLLEAYAKVEVSVEIASEFLYSSHNFDLEDVLYIFVSQSGETADTIAAFKYVNKNKIKSSRTLAIVNVAHSQLAKLCDHYIECFSGPEIGVAATKSFTSQLMCFALFTLKLSFEKRIISEEIFDKFIKDINILPNKIDEFLANKNIMKQVKEMSKIIYQHTKKGKKIIYIGKDTLYGISKEAALKTQELFYLPILAFSAGELKHGPIAILDKDTIAVVIANSNKFYNKISSTIEEISARRAKIALIGNVKHEKADYFLDLSILNEYSDFASPIFYVLPIQLISYKVSLLMGNDVDKPRGLAKSVTVE